MRYCGKYSNKISMDNFDEISIYYDRQDQELLFFLQEHCDKKINLVIQHENIFKFYEEQEWEKINAIHEKYPEYSIAICFYDSCKFHVLEDYILECMKNLTVPYFTGNLATNFDQLHYLLNLGVSEVYLGEEICFDLTRAKKICSRTGVTIRAFPNVGQSSVRTSPALKKFFIRPEDIAEYEDVITTLEFWGPLDRQEILHKIYSKGKWFGDLQDLILDFDLSFDSRRIVPGFAQMRKNCERKCMKGGQCTACDRILNISKLLEDKNLIIKQKKND